MFFGDQGNQLTAKDGNELRGKLSQVDNYVPWKIKGRTSDQRERNSIILYLRALAQADRLNYPIEVEKDESPDFKVTAAERKVALEVTDGDLAGYATADEYHLLVYDNTKNILSVEHVPAAIENLQAGLAEWEASANPERRFSVISIVHEARLIYDLRGECAILEVPG